MFVMVILFIFMCFLRIPLNDAHCMDIHHHMVSQGMHYVPGPNPCTLCICEKGNPKWCKQVLCSPPQNCKSFEVGNSCCEFKCLDDILSKSDNYSETYDLALRLIASAVTAVLSLSLLFFLIHRLRQRKIRLRQNRQMSEDQRSLNSIGYITGSIGYLPGSIGYLGSGNNEMEFHYDESNVHYPLWKPPGNYFPRGEAPPPYEEAVRAARSEAEMANQVNTNGTPYTFSSNRNENVSLTLVHNTHVSITPSVQQPGVASSQCNVMLHQSVPEARIEPPLEPQQNPTTTSVSLACGSGGNSHDYVIDSSSSFLQNATLESQVDVHYENYNHHAASAAPVVTVSVKNEESFPKQALSVDFLRERIDRNTHAEVKSLNENHLPKIESSKRETSTHHGINLKNKNYKVDAAGGSKNYRTESQIDPKFKKCNVIMKEATSTPRSGKSLAGRTYDKQRPQSKCHTVEPHKEILAQEVSSKHRTIPQKFSKTLGPLDSDSCYVNTDFVTKRKQDDDFSEHCDLILKQHNIDKIRYAAEKLDKQKSEKTLNASIRNSLCAPRSALGLLKDASAHRTLPKNLRELSEAFYFNFDGAGAGEELGLECLAKKPPARSDSAQTSFSARKKPHSTNSSASNSASTINPSCYRNSNSVEPVVKSSEKSDLSKETSVESEEKERSCVSYRCSSPLQDDVDDYRSECENCKSLSFEDCNDEEGDLLNETMTLQRRPMEQGEDHSFYRTSLTLPSHTKKATRSVTLNTPRESWFMAMQEMTSSSESD